MATASDIKNVTIVGASGYLGETVIQALQQAGTFNVQIVTRASSAATFPPHLTVHKLPDAYPEANLVSAFKDQDAVISILPTVKIREQFRIIDAAIKAGVKRYIPSNFGLNDVRKDLQEFVPTSKDKGDVITYLRKRESATFTWTALATGSWIDWALKNGYLGITATSRDAEIWDDGSVKFTGTALATSGLAVTRVLQAPEKTVNAFLFVADWSISQNDLLASLERVSGEKWNRNVVSSKEKVRKGKERLENGDENGVFELIKFTFMGGGYGGDYEHDEFLANELLGLPKLDLDEFVTGELEKSGQPVL